MWKLIDKWFDDVSARMAENMTGNMEIVSQNKTARALSELSDPELRKVGLSRQRLEQGSQAYPWRAHYNDLAEEEIKQQVAQLIDKASQSHHSKTVLAA
jgi:uncharacterized protein YjiS (DUF1127 family)